jgi:hypothetical protein
MTGMPHDGIIGAHRERCCRSPSFQEQAQALIALHLYQ